MAYYLKKQVTQKRQSSPPVSSELNRISPIYERIISIDSDLTHGNCMEKSRWYIIQKLSFCVSHKTENHMGLERHNGE